MPRFPFIRPIPLPPGSARRTPSCAALPPPGTTNSTRTAAGQAAVLLRVPGREPLPLSLLVGPRRVGKREFPRPRAAGPAALRSPPSSGSALRAEGRRRRHRQPPFRAGNLVEGDQPRAAPADRGGRLRRQEPEPLPLPQEEEDRAAPRRKPEGGPRTGSTARRSPPRREGAPHRARLPPPARSRRRRAAVPP